MMKVMLVFVILAVAEGYTRSGFVSRFASHEREVNMNRAQKPFKKGPIVAQSKGEFLPRLLVSHNQARSKTRVSVSQQENPITQASDTSIGYTPSGSVNRDILVQDILGDINFCLRSTDGALTGPTRSKLLNSMTNNVFKAIIIGSESEVGRIISKFDEYRIKVGQCTNNGTLCDFETNSEDVMPIPPMAVGTDNTTRCTTSTSVIVSDTGEELNMTPFDGEGGPNFGADIH